jgi:hypothetical protein
VELLLQIVKIERFVHAYVLKRVNVKGKEINTSRHIEGPHLSYCVTPKVLEEDSTHNQAVRSERWGLP